ACAFLVCHWLLLSRGRVGSRGCRLFRAGRRRFARSRGGPAAGRSLTTRGPLRRPRLLGRAVAGGPDGANPELRQLLAMPGLSPVPLARLELEHNDLVAGPVGDDGRLDRRAVDEGGADQRLAIAAEQQYRAEPHRLADVGGHPIDQDPVAFGHLELLSAGGNNGIHGSSAPGRDSVVYHAICSGPWSTWFS